MTWTLWGLHECGQWLCLGSGYWLAIEAYRTVRFYEREGCWLALGCLPAGEAPDFQERGQTIYRRFFGED